MDMMVLSQGGRLKVTIGKLNLSEIFHIYNKWQIG
jgi:hypothetical protein